MVRCLVQLMSVALQQFRKILKKSRACGSSAFQVDRPWRPSLLVTGLGVASMLELNLKSSWPDECTERHKTE